MAATQVWAINIIPTTGMVRMIAFPTILPTVALSPFTSSVRVEMESKPKKLRTAIETALIKIVRLNSSLLNKGLIENWAPFI